MRACLIFLFVVVSVAYAAVDVKPIAPSSTVSPKDAETPKAVPHVDAKNTTAKPNINPVTPSTSTAAYDIPTAASASNSTTIGAPTSTSAPPPAPTPVPDPQIQKWSVNGTDTIIVLRLAAQLDIVYNVTSQQNIKKEINIPADKNVTTATGDFKKNNETIKLSWKASNSSGVNFVAFSFNKNEQSKTYALSSVEVSIDASELPGLNASSLVLKHSKEHFNTTVGHSYRCVKLQNFNLTKEDNQLYGQLTVTDFQFQAFKNDQKDNFGLAEDCAFDTSDVVPIAVGCVLAGLVVIVLVAYLISRRRSQARGYLSM